MAFKICIVLSTLAVICLAQRPSYAGRRPIGYPDIQPQTQPKKPNANELGNRFGEDTPRTTTMRLPIEALGDRQLFDRLSKLPVDQRPFWVTNWQALEEERKRPHTYPQKPPGFVDPTLFGLNFQQWQ